MNRHVFDTRLRTRLPTEEQERLEKINTDYCKGERNQNPDIEGILYEIKYNGQIGGHRL